MAWIKRFYKALLAGAIFLSLLGYLLFFVPGRTNIVIDASYNEEERLLTVSQQILYINRANQPLEEMVLSLYANAFRERRSVPVLPQDMLKAYPKGWSAGGVTVETVSVNGEDVVWEVQGEQRTQLCLLLPKPLPQNGSLTVELKYTVLLPLTTLRTGASASDVRLCNVFAVPAVIDEETGAFRRDSYTAIGDPFLSDCADYDVTLRLSPAFIAAAPGMVSEEGFEDGVWRFKAEDLREFSAVLSKDFCVAQAMAGRAKVRGFAREQEEAQLLADTGAKAVETFSALFGEYAFRDLTLCTCDFSLGGMEYPALALLDQDLLREDGGMAEFVIAHEVAHQWWYAAVGSDQLRHPWQDEALTEYSTLLYFDAVYGGEALNTLYLSMIRPAATSPVLKGLCLDAPVTAFESNAMYDALVYRKGAAMWHDLRVQLGNEAFLSALRQYYAQNRFLLAQPEDLYEAMGETARRSMAEWICGNVE